MAKGTLKISGADAFVAGDIAAGAVDTSELAADAVTGAKIEDDAVDSEHIAADSIDAEHYAPASVDTTAMAASVIGVKPHIIPDVLYPAVANIMVDGSTALSASTTGPNSSTVQSSKYGTVQSDGRMYYYTDIKGSKPIKDPRIGAHFGGQRHKFKSLQLLEQETATHGKDVYSIDGREWMRGVGSWYIWNDANVSGSGVITTSSATADFIEITGYFSAVNYIAFTDTADRSIRATIDGGTEHVTVIGGAIAVSNPIAGRYVDSGMLHQIATTTVGLHTIKIRKQGTGGTTAINAIELIAQDKFTDATCDYNNDPTITHDANTRILAGMSVSGTGIPTGSTVASVTSTTVFELSASTTGGAVTNGTLTFGTNNIQIPSQNVVSYGKKFTVAGIPHYNPFATKGDGSASTIPSNTTGDSVGTGWAGATSAYWDSTLDTATSLGLGAWESGGNFYRPVNGGRVVKWVDSSGNIKTSVNMMPPEAHSINVQDTGLNPATGTHNWSTKYLPSFGNSLVGSDLAVNGDFSSATGWTLEGGGTWSITGGNAVAASALNAQMVYRQIQTVIEPGRKYKVLATASAVTAGTFDVYAWGGGAPTVDGNNITGAGTSSVILEGGDGTTLQYLAIRASGTSSGVFSSITMHEISDVEAQAEVAKTFYWREFGNGSANGNASYKDASTLVASDDQDVAYVMDDGLTSLSGSSVYADSTGEPTLLPYTTDDFYYITFIGTGLSIQVTGGYGTGIYNIVQNLPYGTHILKGSRESGSGTGADYVIDGVDFPPLAIGTYTGANYITFHQPKMPPIPEDAVVIADYMLMADYVANTSNGTHLISKGVRICSHTRDIHYNEVHGFTPSFHDTAAMPGMGYLASSSSSTNATNNKYSLLAFGTTFQINGHTSNTNNDLFINDADVAQSGTAAGNHGDISYPDAAVTLGLNKFAVHGASGQSYSPYLSGTGFKIVSPIHTSSHYQTFETPFLHELVGGDRNMEQTNLVVTPDGKSWDEVTRDTSYLGSGCLNTNRGGGSVTASATIVVFDEWRGPDSHTATGGAYYNKDFAIAYDRIVCLVTGQYELSCFTIGTETVNSRVPTITVNGQSWKEGYKEEDEFVGGLAVSGVLDLKRGDYVQSAGLYYGLTKTVHSHFMIKKV